MIHLQLLLVPLPVTDAGELVPIAEVKGTGQSVSTDIAGGSASEGGEEDVRSVWRVSRLLENAGCPLGHQINHCRLP